MEVQTRGFKRSSKVKRVDGCRCVIEHTELATGTRHHAVYINLLDHVVSGEARGEPYEGQVAVAAVILNRMKDPRFPHSIPAIIYAPGAFTCVSDGQINVPPDPSVKKAVNAAIHGWDPTMGAVYYFDPATATSKWIWSRPEILKIGHHIFCR